MVWNEDDSPWKPHLNTKEVNMASTLIQFRIDNDEKRRSLQILETMGLSLPVYLRMCMLRLNMKKGIPFSMDLDDMMPDEKKSIEIQP